MEISRSPLDGRFVQGLAEKIRPGWEEFEVMAALPAVQEFCAFESRYHYRQRALSPEPPTESTALQESILSQLRFDPHAEHFDGPEAAVVLERMNARVDTFLRAIVQTYCDRKRCAVPEPDDIEEIGAIISKILVGGVDKVYEYMDLSSAQCDERLHLSNQDHYAYLPATLLMLSARLSSARFYEEVGEDIIEPGVPESEIDEAIDAALQEACQRIRDNKKMPIPKGSEANTADRIFAASMNSLRTLYHQGKEKGFKAGLLRMFSPVFKQHADDYLLPGDEVYDIDRFVYDGYSAFADHFNTVLNCDFTFPGHQKAFIQLRDAEEGYEQMDTDPDGFNRRLMVMFYKMYNAHSARHFVDGIADGTMKYSDIVRAMNQLRRQPLSGYDLPEVNVNKMWVDWEMLPPGLIEPGEFGAPPDDMVKPKNPREREVDWRRISRLLSYAVSWGPDASFARTQIPNLPEDKQYYAVILPQQQPDGTVLEHAIADHPEQGHGLYMWRAERGFMRAEGDKNRDLTWREVLAHERMVARQLGARCLYHTKNLEVNVLDYLTAPPESLVQHRYAVGRGAVRMARLARKLT